MKECRKQAKEEERKEEHKGSLIIFQHLSHRLSLKPPNKKVYFSSSHAMLVYLCLKEGERENTWNTLHSMATFKKVNSAQ